MNRTSLTAILWIGIGAGGSARALDVAPSDPSIRILGRSAKDNSSSDILWSWSGSGASITFAGTACSVRMQAPGSIYSVLVDGKESKVLDLSNSANDTMFPLATGLPQGTHKVSIRQRTEAQYSTTRFRGFRIEGTTQEGSASTGRRIEFYGNSITCGYGILDSVASHPFQIQTEHEGLTFGALAADSVDAERHTICWSGRGVIQNYGGDTKSPTVPQIHARSLGGDASSTWDFSRWIPQVVVIDLGTNDYSTASAQPDSAKFFRTYLAFVDTLHARYPQARFVLVDGPMMSDNYPAGLNTLSKLRAHLKNIVSDVAKRGIQATHLSLTSQSDSRGYGAAYHPNRAQARLNAAELASHLRSVVPGWANASAAPPGRNQGALPAWIFSEHQVRNVSTGPIRARMVDLAGNILWRAEIAPGQAQTLSPSPTLRWLVVGTPGATQVVAIPPRLP